MTDEEEMTFKDDRKITNNKKGKMKMEMIPEY
jgi:hypothetical protein